jgi:DNA polymerase-4
VRDALRVDAATFEQWLGPRSGRWLFERIRGRGREHVEPESESKSMSHEETFSRDLASDDALEIRLLRLVGSLAADLRSAGLSAGTVTVKLRDFDFRTRQASRTLPVPVRTDRALFGVARELLGSLRSRRRVAARLLGIAFSSLMEGEGPPQLSLLPPAGQAESGRDRRLATAVDRINAKLGEKAIRPARLVAERARPKSGESRSP